MVVRVLDFGQEVYFLHLKFEIFFGKVLLFCGKCVPLHPLNEKRSFRVRQKASSLKDLHRQK